MKVGEYPPVFRPSLSIANYKKLRIRTSSHRPGQRLLGMTAGLVVPNLSWFIVSTDFYSHLLILLVDKLAPYRIFTIRAIRDGAPSPPLSFSLEEDLNHGNAKHRHEGRRDPQGRP